MVQTRCAGRIASRYQRMLQTGFITRYIFNLFVRHLGGNHVHDTGSLVETSIASEIPKLLDQVCFVLAANYRGKRIIGRQAFTIYTMAGLAAITPYKSFPPGFIDSNYATLHLSLTCKIS